MFVRVFLCAVLIGAASAASTQTQPTQTPAPARPATRQLTPEQRAAMQKQNQELAQYAESLVQMIDNGQSGQIWDEASRKVMAITHEMSTGGKLPASNYISVNFATKFSKESRPLRELVSFHEDSDHKCRLSGYHLYTGAGGAPTAKR